MEIPACHVIYVNRSAGSERLLRHEKDSLNGQWGLDGTRDELQPLLEAFGNVYVCLSGAACLAKLIELHEQSMVDMNPTIILLDTPHDDYVRGNPTSSRPTSPNPGVSSYNTFHAPDEELYGLSLLQKLTTEAHLRNIAKLVVPIPIISRTTTSTLTSAVMTMKDGALDADSSPLKILAPNRGIVRTCLDLGAVDVIISPLNSNCLQTLEICIHKALRDTAREKKAAQEIKKGRQLSWMGVHEEKPYAYIREAMVSGLMKRICSPGAEQEQLPSAHIEVSTERQAYISDAISHWHFSAHALSEDELVVAALLMLRHAMKMPELEKWRIPTDQMISFLVACRAAYNNFVPYHNFRHVVDVLQATFSFLVNLGVIPPYLSTAASPEASPTSNLTAETADTLSSSPIVQQEQPPVALLITPFEALTLLITAIGHDVGHPGVNNGMLVRLKAPLAQLYNDKSVLEAFHCAAYSQLLRKHWPVVFEDTAMRKLMISSILATDMGVHFDFIKRLGDLQERLRENRKTDDWSNRQIDDCKELLCALLIKCADISNVARRHDAALQWMKILNEEFYRQASMESDLNIQTSLVFIPQKDMLSQAKGQIGFVNFLALPLFQGVVEILPAMRYTVDELETNKTIFEKWIIEEEAKLARANAPPEEQLSVEEEGQASGPGKKGASESPEIEKRDREEEKTTTISQEHEATTQIQNSERLARSKKKGNAGSSDRGSKLFSRLTIKTPSLSAPRGGTNKETGTEIATDTKTDHMDHSQPSYDGAKRLADSDPFNARGGTSMYNGNGSTAQVKQRCSETTEGSASGCLPGDWASQATSSATGKVPISPSTKGTSIISRESGERPRSASDAEAKRHIFHELTPNWMNGGSSGGQKSTLNSRNGGSTREPSNTVPLKDRLVSQECKSSTLSHRPVKQEGKTLRKKTSRFRMKGFGFFGRHKLTDSSG